MHMAIFIYHSELKRQFSDDEVLTYADEKTKLWQDTVDCLYCWKGGTLYLQVVTPSLLLRIPYAEQISVGVQSY